MVSRNVRRRVLVHGRAFADTLVAAPLAAAAAIAVWVGHTYPNRTLRERVLASRVIGWCIAAAALVAIVVVTQGGR